MAKKRARVKKKRSPASVAGKLAVAAASVYLVVSFVGGQMQVAERQKELERVKTQVAVQEEANEQLRRMMEDGDTDAYVERIAREQLGFARPDEKVYVDISGQ